MVYWSSVVHSNKKSKIKVKNFLKKFGSYSRVASGCETIIDPYTSTVISHLNESRRKAKHQVAKSN